MAKNINIRIDYDNNLLTKSFARRNKATNLYPEIILDENSELENFKNAGKTKWLLKI
jgi:hypothetical protein